MSLRQLREDSVRNKLSAVSQFVLSPRANSNDEKLPRHHESMSIKMHLASLLPHYVCVALRGLPRRTRHTTQKTLNRGSIRVTRGGSEIITAPLAMKPVRSVAVIGAGVSGIVCSHALRASGVDVHVFDMGARGPGACVFRHAGPQVHAPVATTPNLWPLFTRCLFLCLLATLCYSKTLGTVGLGVAQLQPLHAGGRASTRKQAGFQFDHGCSFIAPPKDDGLKQMAYVLQTAGAQSAGPGARRCTADVQRAVSCLQWYQRVRRMKSELCRSVEALGRSHRHF